jgi:hypothetical protein
MRMRKKPHPVQLHGAPEEAMEEGLLGGLKTGEAHKS